MPTNVSHPIWQCDICKARFDQNLVAAQRCEGAGVPELLADGELLLVVRDYGEVFRLARLERLEGYGSHASRHNDQAGHYGVYYADVEAGMTSRPRYESDSLWPHDPTRHLLNVSVDGRHRRRVRLPDRHSGYYSTPELAGWALERVGLAHTPEQVKRARHQASTPRLVRPITPPVRAVYEMLHACVPGLPLPRPPVGTNDRAVVAAELVGQRDHLPTGVFDLNRVQWWLAQAPDGDGDPLGAVAIDRKRRWWAGEDVVAPRPELRSSLRRGMSASKLNKAQREIVEATGMPWPERTGADEYLRLVTTELLGEQMTRVDNGSAHQDQALFLNARKRIAVTSTKGGVGKTTVAGALAAALAALGERVLLIDLNLPNPGQQILWGLGPVATDPERRLLLPTLVLQSPDVPGTLQVFSHGQLAPDSDPTAQALDITKADQWLRFLAGTLDLAGATPENAITTVLFDLPPGWDSLHQLVFSRSVLELTDCVHVTTGHPLAVAGEYLPAQQVTSPYKVRHWLVENLSRATVTTPAGDRVEGSLYGGQGAVQELAEQAGVRYGGSLPWQPDSIQLARSAELLELATTIHKEDISS